MQNIKRESYLKRIRPFYNKQLIKVLTGQRRVGKSFLLRQIADEIKEQNPGCNLIYINKELYEFKTIHNDTDLFGYVKLNSKPENNILIIDEVQEIKAFELALRSLLAEKVYDIYCTGSNSSIFSSELSTFLSGRQMEFHIHSLSYPEFLQFHRLENSSSSLMKYLKYGGLPYLIYLPDEESIIFDYLKNILSTIIYRDVINRHQIRDTTFFDDLISYLADNTGYPFSANKISGYLKSQKINKSVSIIIDYLGYLENATIIHKVKRKDILGKKLFEIGDKFYFEDLGLRNVINGYRPADINKILENVVFNHLQYLNFKVNIGKSDNREIDFVAEKDNELIYLQVAYILADQKVIDREFGNLDKINDHYPKYVISMDEFPINTSYKGIKHIKLIDFLSSDTW
jgi:uncharacterized protein